jgi:hypothetical protein
MEYYMKPIDENKRILVGVMHVTRDPWLRIAQLGQFPSWGSQKYRNFETVYFFSRTSRIANYLDSTIENLKWRKGRNAAYGISYLLMWTLFPLRRFVPRAVTAKDGESGVDGFSLKVAIPELTASMRWKKLAFLKFFLSKTSSDYVIITNSSSILNLAALGEFFEGADDSDSPIYAGPINSAHDGVFTSGSFTVMNRKAAELLLKNTKIIPTHTMDDVCFGTAFKRMGVEPIQIDSLSIENLSSLANLETEYLGGFAHFRLKSGPLDNRADIEIMQQLIETLKV